jgi:hypothetical protein
MSHHGAQLRCPAADGDQTVERHDCAVGVDAPLALHLQRLTGELVNDMQQLDDPPVSGLVVLEVKRPHVIRALRAQSARRDRRLAEALTLAPPLRDAQALLAPQPLRALAIHAPALLEQPDVRTPVPPTRPLPRKLPQSSAQRRVITRDARLAALRRAMLPGDQARPPLRHTKPVLEHQDRLASPRRCVERC